jgi:hypothetical protein
VNGEKKKGISTRLPLLPLTQSIKKTKEGDSQECPRV